MTTFLAEVLLENHAMLDVLTDAGFALTREVDADTVAVRLDTSLSAQGVAAADARERRAEAPSLHPLLYPHSVAVVGVRSDGQGIGRAVLENIRHGGFPGELFVVHPRLESEAGVTAVARFADLPHAVDLAMIAVPADKVLAAVAEAADAGIPAAVVISSGFEELGLQGARLQRELARLARDRSIRVVGPTASASSATLPRSSSTRRSRGRSPRTADSRSRPSREAWGSCWPTWAGSSAWGSAAWSQWGTRSTSPGMTCWPPGPTTPGVTAAALYLESFGNARKFARVARRFAERKPLMAGGRRAL